MDEQRQQDYLQLIQSLLNCRSKDQVQEILTAKHDLLDVGFLQMLEAQTQKYSQQGDENTANWLQGVASYLREALNQDTQVHLRSLSEKGIQAYFQFLMEVLLVTRNSNHNAQVIYPLLAKNIDKLDGMLAKILRHWGTNALREMQPGMARTVAKDIGNFSILIEQFPLGNKARNMEIAITGYQVALSVCTCEGFPYDWATLLYNLGNAYSNRIAGEKRENLEQAIAYLQDALKVYTFDAFPYQWASTQVNLAIAYSNRIEGQRADNLEQAIAYLQDALKVYTFDAFPYQWAITQNNLGLAYSNRITLNLPLPQ